MRNGWFVFVYNPSNGARFAITDGVSEPVMVFNTYDEARDAARHTLFGETGHYEIYSTESEQ
jgi:hypothetical protein